MHITQLGKRSTVKTQIFTDEAIMPSLEAVAMYNAILKQHAQRKDTLTKRKQFEEQRAGQTN